jgi:hypothetical protein
MAPVAKKPTSLKTEPTQPNRQGTAAYITGGIFLGVWAYGILFGFPDWDSFSFGRWFFWGFLGFLIAGGLYAARITTEGVRIGIVIFVGICLGMLLFASMLEAEAHIIASFLVSIGAGLIASALPRIKINQG